MAKVMVSLPDEFLKRVDRFAKARGQSRSELVREALRTMIARKDEPRSWKAAVAPLAALEQEWVGRWNSTDVIRQDRELRDGRKGRP